MSIKKYHTHEEKLIARRQAYQLQKDKHKKYREDHKEQISKSKKAIYERNKAIISEKYKAYYLLNKDRPRKRIQEIDYNNIFYPISTFDNKETCQIYIIINHADSNKVYIGQTWEGLKKRYQKHCQDAKDSFISRAIRKYGEENFSTKILAECYNQKDADKLEIGFIKEYKSFGYDQQYGYNLTPGGRGVSLFQMWKMKHPNVLCKICNNEIPMTTTGHYSMCSEECFERHKDILKKIRIDKNPDKYKQYRKEQREKNKEKLKIYFELNADRISAMAKIRYQANKEEIKASKNARYQLKKEEIKAKEKERYRRNKEIINQKNIIRYNERKEKYNAARKEKRKQLKEANVEKSNITRVLGN